MHKNAIHFADLLSWYCILEESKIFLYANNESNIASCNSLILTYLFRLFKKIIYFYSLGVLCFFQLSQCKKYTDFSFFFNNVNLSTIFPLFLSSFFCHFEHFFATFFSRIGKFLTVWRFYLVLTMVLTVMSKTPFWNALDMVFDNDYQNPKIKLKCLNFFCNIKFIIFIFRHFKIFSTVLEIKNHISCIKLETYFWLNKLLRKQK